VKDYEAYIKQLGVKIRSLRNENGWNQKFFGAEVGIDERHLRDIEKGRTNPRIDTLYSIAKKLGLSVSDLLITKEDHKDS